MIEVVRRLLDRAVHDWKIVKALRLVQEGRWTVRRATKFAELSYHETLDKMVEMDVDSGPILKNLQESLGHH